MYIICINLYLKVYQLLHVGTLCRLTLDYEFIKSSLIKLGRGMYMYLPMVSGDNYKPFPDHIVPIITL